MIRPIWGSMVVALSLVGCGPPAHLATADGVSQAAPSEQREELAASLAELRGGPRAEEVRAELDRAETWLAQAERLNAEDEQPERVGLLLEGAATQLAAVKAHYARARAEENYEALRERVENQP
ncbi:MAG: hypothetical protein AAF928_21460 [Myxococcota bacterium]